MKPTKIYSDHVEPVALQQFESAMEQDFAVKGALMPDVYPIGYSLPIGAVVATKGVIVPAWVGYDIGCGMCAVATTYSADDIRANAEKIFDAIYRNIPTGFHVHQKQQRCYFSSDNLYPLGAKAFKKLKGTRSLGTLGGGNHFIEIGQDEFDNIWIIVHSGSRGLGHGVAVEYMRAASGGKKAKEGHYGLPVDSHLGYFYINDMKWASDFALLNRSRLISATTSTIARYCAGHVVSETLINRSHNHAELKDGLWIHRKGATHAEDGMKGVIPGNMKDGSFIVIGKGDPDSLCSSSHGAGRVGSRKKARETLNLEDFKEDMKGITAKVEVGTIDESRQAYKDIFDVIAAQDDLVEVVHHIKPIINVKA